MLLKCTPFRHNQWVQTTSFAKSSEPKINRCGFTKPALTRGVRRCFWMGGLTVWVAQPTYRRVWGRLLGNIFYVYALKSILVHSETKLISLIGTILKTIRVNSNWGCVALFWNMGGYSPPSPPASYASAHMLTKCTTWKYYLWPDLRKPTTL